MIPQPAGLNLQQLRGIAARRRGSRAHQHLLDRIGEHLDEHDGFVSWSGGKDSTVVVDLARQVDPHIPVVFFDSGLQFPETIQYLEDLSDTWRLNYHVIAAEPDLLTVLIAGGGFSHEAPDRRLRGQLADIMITGPANEAHSRYGGGSLWGVRAEESHGRRMLYRRSLATETLARQLLSPEDVRALMDTVEKNPQAEVSIDLVAGTCDVAGFRCVVSLPPKVREAFTTGAWDTTGMLLENFDDVQATAARLPYVDGF